MTLSTILYAVAQLLLVIVWVFMLAWERKRRRNVESQNAYLKGEIMYREMDITRYRHLLYTEQCHLRQLAKENGKLRHQLTNAKNHRP